ncbi:MAG: sigma-70 family RNA polymerase sigma factor [Planctomycetota bacterium]
MGPSDAQCIAEFLAGDPKAFSLLVDRYQRAVVGLAWRMTGDRAAAEDLFQEIFLKVWRSVGRLRDPDRFRTWLFTLAVRHIRRFVRTRGSRPIAASETLENQEDPCEQGDRLEAQEEIAALRRAVSALPPRQREVIMLHGYQGLSYGDVAAIVGGTEEGARANFYQALRRLRNRLARTGRGTDGARLADRRGEQAGETGNLAT